ncbi:unnamed protein product [Caenorhabditis auriculariae]|uniref:Uncharacterized protein n=1 Tax=Caenorhabditis auriculariae TaxID=2777116 RepID=A0A8S1HWI9_9PELO|nr:unnamed protein product [Caenorhabditis auriculariae]
MTCGSRLSGPPSAISHTDNVFLGQAIIKADWCNHFPYLSALSENSGRGVKTAFLLDFSAPGLLSVILTLRCCSLRKKM